MNLIALQVKTTEDFTKNLEHLKELIQDCPEDSIILAPEIALSGFCYGRMQEASEFSTFAIKHLQELAVNKTIALTLITKKNKKFYNTLHIFDKQKIIHTQSKVKLFPLGNELEHFDAGNEEDIKIIEINGLKIATLICFELRFPELWQKVAGADIILNPAMWGLKRKDHYETISKSLALINQCFVIACNSADLNMAKGSAIISPFGNVFKDDEKEIIIEKIDLDEISKVRKYINIGLKI
ncbi:carbon-nitrogen hydrolase family protein [Poseidonibacter lekithochrous]|uniref:nitrilase-related carbon-nitrogen hydrolase n=1 Tax=Poseidonibacter TaxID=2321187 RepID=UPI001C0A2F7F|nr:MULTISPECIES: nitrilase-related carbon-nitrogen hydrolase [Poseidonibacter]MBU3015251.1 carbon-nitrogen hydrolase family protein [Poseidonibacter lekithochrous]MDO6828549.1 nitrilase-related carbon-nitrogen hydrolase [Poseidonibacter sp. 1_MG-2023]